MEDRYAQSYTVEADLSKGWEIVAVRNDLESAILEFRRQLLELPIVAVRLTSPTDLTIYGGDNG